MNCRNSGTNFIVKGFSQGLIINYKLLLSLRIKRITLKVELKTTGIKVPNQKLVSI